MKEVYEEISTKFGNDLHGFYQGNQILEEVTQNCWRSMELSRRRLTQLGLQMDLKIHENGVSGPYDNHIFHEVTTMERGEREYTSVVTPVSTRKIYSNSQGRIVSSKKDYIQKATCIVQGLKNEKGQTTNEIVCPFCGGIQTREALVDGCDYCGRTFEVSLSGKKVSSYHVFHDFLKANEVRVANMKRTLSFWLCIIVAGVLALGTGVRLGDESAVGYGFYKLLKLVIVLLLIVFASLLARRTYLRKHPSQRLQESEALGQLNQKCPEFSFAQFGESLEYKLKMLHFAQNPQDVIGIYEGETAPILERYRNVVDSQMKSCRVETVMEDAECYRIQARVTNFLSVYEKNKIKEQEEVVRLSLHIAKNQYQSNSLVSYSCSNCGASIDLIQGAGCTYCGTKLEMDHYDWVVDSYQVIRTEAEGQKLFLARIATVAVLAVVLFCNTINIGSACKAIGMGISSSSEIYSLGNEFIPSLGNYGYSILSPQKQKISEGQIYKYTIVDTKKHFFTDYPKKLVEENDFIIVEQKTDYVVLERDCEFSKQTLRVTLEMEDGSYVVKMERR